ncbi:MAG: hypothetical protein GX272_12430 [Epulopiscium sp.]|nr:hypothetical protein [Candidatus Epulonipiscium sp.]
MQYILGIIGILIIIALIFWAGIGILALIGLAFKYLSILIAAFIGVSLLYGFITKKHDKQKVKSYLATIIVCIGLYAISFPILNLTGSVWDWAQEDNKKENVIEENEILDEAAEEANAIDEVNKEDEASVEKDVNENQINKQDDEDETISEDSEIWTKENIVEKLNSLKVLNNKGKFNDYGDGSKVYVHNDSTDGKTKIDNPYSLQLSIISEQGTRITDKEICSEIVFNIVHELYKHRENIDFNISSVHIVFYNTDGISKTTGSDWDNFHLGINTINNYFSKPRADKVGISTVDGSITEIKFDSSSFYQWIEDNFTQPEDLSVLAEDMSWTTTSSKGAIFP